MRLRSCHGRYLAATKISFSPWDDQKQGGLVKFDNNLSWKFEWKPVRDSFQVRLRSWCGKLLRGNGATLSWRNTVTDSPSLTHSWSSFFFPILSS
ncbi:hypothetical protein AAHE18_16G172400 [Arachis hypogaea]